MQATKEHRKPEKGMADLLNYAAVVDDGIITLKDGTFMAGWFFRGADNHSATATQINHQSIQINSTLKGLGAGWMMHCDAIRMPAEKYDLDKNSFFTDPVSAAIEKERKGFFSAQGNAYESMYCLVLSYQPPSLRQQKLTDMMFDEGGKVKKNVTAVQRGELTLNHFKEQIDQIQGELSQVLDMQRMVGVPYVDEFGDEHINDQLLSYINRCVTGDVHPMNLPPVPMYLDCLIGRQDFFGGVTPKVGDKFIIPVAIDGFPHESFPGILQILDTVGADYRWSTRFIFMEPHEAETELNKYRKKWKQKVRGIFDQLFKTSKGTVNTDALNMSQQAEQAINDVNSGEVAYGYYTSVLIFMGEDLEEVEEIAKDVSNKIKTLGFPSRVETINAMEAFFGSLPGHSQENIRRPMMNTLNLSHLLPTSSIWAGSRKAPCPFYSADAPALMHCATHGNTPFRFNFHVGDLGHALVIGPPGAGKSTLLGITAAQFRRYQNATVFGFDKGRSMLPLCKGVGGNHFDVAHESATLAFSPLSNVKTVQDAAWYQDWIETIVRLQGIVPTPQQRTLINEAVKSCLDTGSTTMSDLQVAIQNQEIKDCLEPYCVGGSFGHLMDAESDGLSISDFNIFEIEELMNLDDKIRLPVLLYLFWRVEKMLHGQPAMLILDEAWLMLGHPVFREKIREWLKVLRKANCIVILATQSISDAANSGILDVLQEGTATKIYLPNPEANNEESFKLYKKMGLNDREIAIISKARKKRDYYYTSATGKRLIDLALGRVALAFVGVSDKEGIARVNELEQEHGENWPAFWLSENNINADILVEEVA